MSRSQKVLIPEEFHCAMEFMLAVEEQERQRKLKEERLLRAISDDMAEAERLLQEWRTEVKK